MMKHKTTKKHLHFWYYPHSIWQGFKTNQVLVARYCQCGEIQIAIAQNLKKADKKTKVYPDAIDECKKAMTESPWRN